MMEPLININQIIEKLRSKRRVFNSEADFQFALSWIIKEIYGERVNIRLEYSTMTVDEKMLYIDIVVVLDSKHFIPIELKYKTTSTNGGLNDNGENFYLKSQGAQDLGKFDYLLDIERVESYREIYGFSEGYCILLTNDDSYTKASNRDTRNREFNIGHGQTKSGLMTWRNDSSIYLNKHRKESIELHGKYVMDWRIFHDFKQGKNTKFYILVNRICVD